LHCLGCFATGSGLVPVLTMSIMSIMKVDYNKEQSRRPGMSIQVLILDESVHSHIIGSASLSSLADDT